MHFYKSFWRSVTKTKPKKIISTHSKRLLKQQKADASIYKETAEVSSAEFGWLKNPSPHLSDGCRYPRQSLHLPGASKYSEWVNIFFKKQERAPALKHGDCTLHRMHLFKNQDSLLKMMEILTVFWSKVLFCHFSFFLSVLGNCFTFHVFTTKRKHREGLTFVCHTSTQERDIGHYNNCILPHVVFWHF